MSSLLTPSDREQIDSLGLSELEIRRQLELLRNPPPPADLVRACRVGDGIVVVPEERQGSLAAAAESAAREGRLSKMVPASGAATRMFKSLLKVTSNSGRVSRSAVESAAADGDDAAADVLALIDELESFPFFEELKEAMDRSGQDLDDYRRRGDLSPILDHLLQPLGLGYGALPKGLILFHHYPGSAQAGPRTAFEEQLADGAAYVRDADGLARLHFTVPPEYQSHFESRLEASRAPLAEATDCRFEVTFSNQERSTDTVAVTLDHQPFRREDGSLLLRPGGHGSLIGNLAGSGGDVVVLKNIDNVLPQDREHQALQVRWKKILLGLLVTLQAELFEHLRRLEAGEEGAVEAAAAFARESLGLELPPGRAEGDLGREALLAELDRPLRVCGMVENRGEPGGGPFWVRGRDGRITRQIVESAQIDPSNLAQRAVLAASTHFNPVDLVCGLRDHRGEAYDLARFVDPSAAFVTEKTLAGQKLKALEHPGLWNGAMAGWLTVFVEVPAETFAPVKTVLDLLREEHRGG